MKHTSFLHANELHLTCTFHALAIKSGIFNARKKIPFCIFFSARLIIFKLHVNLGVFCLLFFVAWTYVAGVSHSPIATAFGIPSILNLPIFSGTFFSVPLDVDISFFFLSFFFYIKLLWGRGLASFQSN